MRRFIFLLIVLIGSVWAGLKIAADPGLALFTYQNWSMEMPLWFAMLALIIVFYLGYFILRVINSVDFSLYRWKNWLKWRKRYKSYSKTNQGLLQLIEGHWQASEKFLLEGIDQADSPLINLLAAAKSAHEQEAYDRRDSYISQAYDFAPNAEIAIGIVQARLQMDQGQLEQALATLQKLRHQMPKHLLVLQTLQQIYIRLNDWRALNELLPTLKKVKLLSGDESLQMERKIYLELLEAIPEKNSAALKTTWDAIPKKLKLDPAITSCYIRKSFNDPEANAELETLIRKIVKNNWDEQLVKLYGILPSSKPTKQLAYAEEWIASYSNQAMLFLTLGRVALRCQLWGKARSYFETSLRLQPLAETYVEYGRLLDQLNEPTAAAQCYRNGLMLAIKV